MECHRHLVALHGLVAVCFSGHDRIQSHQPVYQGYRAKLYTACPDRRIHYIRMGIKRGFDYMLRRADRSLPSAVYGFRAAKAQPASHDIVFAPFADHLCRADDHFGGSRTMAGSCNVRIVLRRSDCLPENHGRQYQKRTEKDVPYLMKHNSRWMASSLHPCGYTLCRRYDVSFSRKAHYFRVCSSIQARYAALPFSASTNRISGVS